MTERGKVIKSTGKWYFVELENGNIVNCRIRGRFKLQALKTTNPIAVGDEVEVDDSEDNEGNRLIVEIHERKNYIVRKSTNLSKQMQILAANIDRAYLMMTIHSPETLLAFVDRFLVAAESFRIPTSILINKIDLLSEDELEYAKAVAFMYEKIDYPVHLISAENKENIDFLRKEINGQQVMISGNSGTGKSTLVNALDANLNLKTSEISSSHQQGQHTTTFAEMHKLQTGGYIVDTPGIRGFGVVDLEKEHLAHYFPEMRNLLGKCKFHNCRHLNEPNCAVKAAVEEGIIYESRYQTYLQLMEENPDDVYRKNIYG